MKSLETINNDDNINLDINEKEKNNQDSINKSLSNHNHSLKDSFNKFDMENNNKSKTNLKIIIIKFFIKKII